MIKISNIKTRAYRESSVVRNEAYAAKYWNKYNTVQYFVRFKASSDNKIVDDICHKNGRLMYCEVVLSKEFMADKMVKFKECIKGYCLDKAKYEIDKKMNGGGT